MSNLLENNITQFETKLGKLTIVKLLGKGKSGYSYLATNNGSGYVLKLMHDEPCAYYNFEGNKTELEVESYKRLSALNLPMPIILEYDFDKNYIVKEFINGPTATEMIIHKAIQEYHIQQLFEMSNKIKTSGWNIDFFPSNFVVENELVFYIDYESNKFMEEWSLEKWGIYYWANSEGFQKFDETKDPLYINSDLKKGIPIKEPFEKIVKTWIKKYSN